MSTDLVVNGVTYAYPETGDLEWGDDATNWSTAVTSGCLQKAGGTFTLTAEAYFGTNYGLKSLYYKSNTANVAAAGLIRLAKTDDISFRNNANSADLELDIGGDDLLQFEGVDLADISTAQTLTNKSIDGDDNTITDLANASIKAAAAIAVNKLAALTASRATATDGSGFLVSATTTATELGYVNGVTSAIQTQLAGKQTQVAFEAKSADFTAATTKGYLLDTSDDSFTFVEGDVSVGDDNITETSHGMANLTAIYLTTDGTLPSPLVENQIYYVHSVATDTFELATTMANAEASSTINLTDDGGGADTHTLHKASCAVVTLPTDPSLNDFFEIKDVSGNANTCPVVIKRVASEKIEGVATAKVFQSDWGSWRLALGVEASPDEWFIT